MLDSFWTIITTWEEEIIFCGPETRFSVISFAILQVVCDLISSLTDASLAVAHGHGGGSDGGILSVGEGLRLPISGICFRLINSARDSTLATLELHHPPPAS